MGLGEQGGSPWVQGGGSLSELLHPFTASLFLPEKKMEQEELKLERARDSSEGESQRAQDEEAALSLWPLWHPHSPRGDCAHLLLLSQAATSMETRRGEALAPAGTPSCPPLASSNVPFAPAR